MPTSTCANGPSLFVSISMPIIRHLGGSTRILHHSGRIIYFSRRPTHRRFTRLDLEHIRTTTYTVVVSHFLSGYNVITHSNITAYLLYNLIASANHFRCRGTSTTTFRTTSHLITRNTSPTHITLRICRDVHIRFLRLGSVIVNHVGAITRKHITCDCTCRDSLRTYNIASSRYSNLISIIHSIVNIRIYLFLGNVRNSAGIHNGLHSGNSLGISRVTTTFNKNKRPTTTNFSGGKAVLRALAITLPVLTRLIKRSPTSIAIRLWLFK